MGPNKRKLKHVGMYEKRLKDNPMELAFSEEWKRQQSESNTLEWLLCLDAEGNSIRELNQTEATCAATMMQWLGSPVGFGWLEVALENAGYKLVEINRG